MTTLDQMYGMITAVMDKGRVPKRWRISPDFEQQILKEAHENGALAENPTTIFGVPYVVEPINGIECPMCSLEDGPGD